MGELRRYASPPKKYSIITALIGTNTIYMKKLSFLIELKEARRVKEEYRDPRYYDKEGVLIPRMYKVDKWDKSFRSLARHDQWMLQDIIKGKSSRQTKTMVFFVNKQGQLDSIVWDRFEYPAKITNIFPTALCYAYREDYFENSLSFFVVDNTLIKKFMPGLVDEFELKNSKGSYDLNNVTAEHCHKTNTVTFTKRIKDLDLSEEVIELKERFLERV
jgi:hypothetical protein